MLKLLTKIGIAVIISGSLVVLGNAINGILGQFDWLITIFKILRTIIIPLDYMVDIPEFIACVGYIISLFSGFWAARAAILVVNYFNR